MRISGLVALSLFLAFAAVDGVSIAEVVLSSFLLVLVMAPDPSAK